MRPLMLLAVLLGFALFIQVADAAPSYSNETVSPEPPQEYSASREYAFTIEWRSDLEITNVSFESDFSGEMVREIVASDEQPAYTTVVEGIPAGTYQYRWIANDSSGSNMTAFQDYTVETSTPVLGLMLDGSGGNVSVGRGSTITITGNSAEGAPVTIEANFNGTTETIATGTTSAQHTLNTTNMTLGEYNITLISGEDPNYNPNRTTSYLTVIDSDAPVIAASLSSESVSRNQGVTVSFTVSDPDEPGLNATVTITSPSGYSESLENATSPLAFSNTTEIGEYAVEIEATDSTGNTAREVLRFSVGTAPGMEGISLSPGESSTITLDGTFNVVSITVTANKTVNGTIRAARAVIPSIPPEGVVLSYFKIETAGFQVSDLSSMEIEYRIPLQWKADNEITQSSIALQGLKGTWDRLPAERTFQGSEYENYKSTSQDDFTLYAITGDRPLPPVVEPPISEQPPSDGGIPFVPIIVGLLALPAVVFVAVKRRALGDFFGGLRDTIRQNVLRMKKADPEKVTKRLSSLQEEMYKRSMGGQDITDAKIRIDEAAIALKNNDAEAAEYYLYEAEKLLKGKKR